MEETGHCVAKGQIAQAMLHGCSWREAVQGAGLQMRRATVYWLRQPSLLTLLFLGGVGLRRASFSDVGPVLPLARDQAGQITREGASARFQLPLPEQPGHFLPSPSSSSAPGAPKYPLRPPKRIGPLVAIRPRTRTSGPGRWRAGRRLPRPAHPRNQNASRLLPPRQTPTRWRWASSIASAGRGRKIVGKTGSFLSV
jgi:hypothetical protein